MDKAYYTARRAAKNYSKESATKARNGHDVIKTRYLCCCVTDQRQMELINVLSIDLKPNGPTNIPCLR